MSDSSDFEDCYGYIEQKLKKLKRKYDIMKRLSIIKKDKHFEVDRVSANTSNTVVAEEIISLSDSEESDPDFIIKKTDRKKKESASKICMPKNEASTSRCKRKTTASQVTHTTKRGRRKTNAADIPLIDIANTSELTPNCGRRGIKSTNTVQSFTGGKCQRGGRTSRSRNRVQNMIDPNLPIFSVGNTGEYPDQLENCELFKPKTNNAIVINDEPMEDIEELSVTVKWQSAEFIKFTLRRYQKFTIVFEYFSKRENIPVDKIVFFYNDKVIHIKDSPDSIDYNIAKFIEGGALKHPINELMKGYYQPVDKKKVKKPTGINIKFQCNISRRPFVINIETEDKMHLAMLQFAEHIEVDLKKLKFFFDGDLITGKQTPEELELENEDIIDVKVSN